MAVVKLGGDFLMAWDWPDEAVDLEFAVGEALDGGAGAARADALSSGYAGGPCTCHFVVNLS